MSRPAQDRPEPPGFDREVAQWLASGRRRPSTNAFSIADLVACYRDHVKRCYRSDVGDNPSQVDRSKSAPARKPGKRYDANSYRNAISAGIRKANAERRRLDPDASPIPS